MQMVDALQGVVLFFCKSCLVKRLNTHIHASVSSSCICIVHSTVFKTYNRRAWFSFVTGIIQVSTTFPLYVNYNQSSPIKKSVICHFELIWLQTTLQVHMFTEHIRLCN